MNSQLQPTQSFEQKMKEKIRESIGDLITEEDLEKLILKGINDTFFEPRPEPSSSGYSRSFKQPLIQELLREVLQPTIKTMLSEWAQDNQELIKQEFEKVSTNMVPQVLAKAVSDIFANSFQSFRFQLQTDLQNFMTNNQF